LIEQASNGVKYITSLGSFITLAKASHTFQWQFQYVRDSSLPVLVSSVGNFWQGLIIAPGYRIPLPIQGQAVPQVHLLPLSNTPWDVWQESVSDTTKKKGIPTQAKFNY